MRVLATVRSAADNTRRHDRRVRRIAARDNLPLFYICRDGLIPKGKVNGQAVHVDASLNGRKLVATLRRQFTELGIKMVTYYPPPDPRLYIYPQILQAAARYSPATVVIKERGPSPQPA